jgi:hypothetical protein
MGDKTQKWKEGERENLLPHVKGSLFLDHDPRVSIGHVWYQRLLGTWGWWVCGFNKVMVTWCVGVGR